MNRIKQIGFGLAAIFVLLFADQYTKSLAVTYLKGADSIVWIPKVFELSYLENHGAAFGIFQGQKIFFILITCVLVGLLWYLYFQILDEKKYAYIRWLILLLTAGAIGNFIDRITHDYVIDFFYFSLIDFPVFNVADIYIVAAVAILMFVLCFYYKEEDIDDLISRFPFTKKNVKNRENS